MGKNLSPEEMELYSAIDKILWRDWDPNGVNNMPGARDEYHSYLPHIFRLTIEGKNAGQISSSLVTIIEGSIGLGSSKEHCLKIARKIVGAKNNIIG